MEMDTFQDPFKRQFLGLLSVSPSLLLHPSFFLFSTKITAFVLATNNPDAVFFQSNLFWLTFLFDVLGPPFSMLVVSKVK